jgi:hypothetical protein
VRVTFVQHYGIATNIYNRFFYSFTGSMNTANATSIATTAVQNWESAIASLLSTTYGLDKVIVTDLGSASGAQVEHPAGVFGSAAAADFLPASTCMCISGVIGRRYRGGKPRWYQTGHHQSSLQDNQTFTGTAVSTWEAAITELAAGQEGLATTGGTVGNNINLSLVDGYQWVEYTTSSGKVNYRKDPIYRATAVEDQIIAWIPLPRVSSQRKRGVN